MGCKVRNGYNVSPQSHVVLFCLLIASEFSARYWESEITPFLVGNRPSAGNEADLL